MLFFATAALANPGAFEGTWVYAGGDAGRAAIEAAVEEGAQRFNFAIRPIVRVKLRKACSLDESLTVTGDETNIIVAYSGANARKNGGPSDGTKVPIDDSMVSYKVDGNTLTVDGANDDGRKLSVYTITGDTMKVDHMIQGSALGDPLRWSLTYKRK